MQNTLARVVTRTKKYDHIAPVLCCLHWLPIQCRIEYKVQCWRWWTERQVNQIISATPSNQPTLVGLFLSSFPQFWINCHLSWVNCLKLYQLPLCARFYIGSEASVDNKALVWCGHISSSLWQHVQVYSARAVDEVYCISTYHNKIEVYYERCFSLVRSIKRQL